MSKSDEEWDRLFAAHPEFLDKMAELALQAYRDGNTTPMFDENGEWMPFDEPEVGTTEEEDEDDDL